MVRYIFRRLLQSIPVLWGVITLIFILFAVVPGDPARMVLGQRADSSSLAMVRADLGLDKPVMLQYFKYLNDLSPVSWHRISPSGSYFYLDKRSYAPYLTIVSAVNWKIVLKFPYLRRSYQSRKEVGSMIRETLPNTFILALASILLASVVGIFFGILAAIWKDSLFDKSVIVVASLGMSLPSFFAAILIGWIFAFLLARYTGLNLTGNIYEISDYGNGIHLALKNLILPAVTLGVRPLSVVVQLTRNSLLDVLSEDYIRTARAKGLSSSRIIIVHALRNALNPVLTAISGWFASLMAGVVFVEYIFGWKGLGFMLVNALNNYDLPVVMGTVIIIALIFILVNILVDIAYSWLDPRIRYA